MSRLSCSSSWLVVLIGLCAPGIAAAQFFTLDQATGTTSGEIAYSHVTFDALDDVSASLLRGFVEYPTAQSGDRWSGYLSFATPSASGDDGGRSLTIDGILGIEIGGAYTTDVSPDAAFTARLGATLPRSGDFDEFSVASLTLPARLTDFILLLPETFAVRFAASFHGRSGSLVYRVDGGLDAPLAGELGEDLDTLLRLNGALGVLAGPATIGVELANLTNTQASGDDATLHTLTAGVRGDFSGIQPGIAVTVLLNDDIGEAFERVLQFSLRASLP